MERQTYLSAFVKNIHEKNECFVYICFGFVSHNNWLLLVVTKGLRLSTKLKVLSIQSRLHLTEGALSYRCYQVPRKLTSRSLWLQIITVSWADHVHNRIDDFIRFYTLGTLHMYSHSLICTRNTSFACRPIKCIIFKCVCILGEKRHNLRVNNL